MAAVVGCDNVRDNLAVLFLLAEIKNISAMKEKKIRARIIRETQDLREKG